MEDSLKEKYPHLPKCLAGLGELASNLWWSWQPEARNLFTMLDPLAWRETEHNPVKLLQALSAQTLEPRQATLSISVTMTRSWSGFGRI